MKHNGVGVSTVFAFNLTPEEKRHLKRLAYSYGVSMSVYLRHLIRAAAGIDKPAGLPTTPDELFRALMGPWGEP